MGDSDRQPRERSCRPLATTTERSDVPSTVDDDEETATMRIGVSIPTRSGATGRDIRKFCMLAEELGFASLWQGDHVVIPDRITSEYPYAYRFRPDIEDLFPDPGFMDACTQL